ncbi:hypothetical protein [Rhodococcoides fascians]|uniref:hypothetical protein n=1 Tax=Rhodococcoides fascians TaxID=1828 RepID=UPI00050CCF33|nr:hypothetical protein [Rhodococcus fascians]
MDYSYDTEKRFGLDVAQIRELEAATRGWPADAPVQIVTETTTLDGKTIDRIRTGFRAVTDRATIGIGKHRQ